jgi:two-component system LytT family sensor kinase
LQANSASISERQADTVQPQPLLTFLLRLGVVAALASILVRSNAFKRMLMREERTLNQRLLLTLSFAAIFGAGVAIRVITKTYQAVDLGLEASFLAGVLSGYVTGLASGVLIAIPAMANGEYLSMPLLAAVGILGGLLRDCAPDTEDVWRFSPLFDLSIYRLFRRGQDRSRAIFQLYFLFAIVFAEFLRGTLDRLFPGFVFHVPPSSAHPLAILAVYLTTVFAVTLPLKIWNNARNEAKLAEQQQLLMHARLEALSSQINPHFLFNTLNSVSSLIRTAPEEARAVVYKLSNILRRLLRKHENFSALRDELSFIDDYLAIEMVRFGEKLRFERDISPATLDILVPSMMLQPLVENSIRHGLSGKVEGGMIRIRSQAENGRIRLSVEDDGVGIPEAKLARLLEQGIGVSNVNERLKVLFGSDYRMYVESKPGAGTRIEIEFPELVPSSAAAAGAPT